MSIKTAQSGRSLTVYWDDMPWVAPANQIVEKTFTVKVPFAPVRVWSFVGVDQGDLGEFALDVADAEGTRVYSRSVHKEVLANYDAWENIHLIGSASGKWTFHVLAHCTGRAGRLHVEVILEA